MSVTTDHWPITFEQVVAARERLAPLLAVTPLREYAMLNEALGARVLVKHENVQPTNAFKVRNGVAALTAMPAAARARGVVAATMGNHGLGLAWAGRALGTSVTICLPHGVNEQKIAALRGLGARLVQEGNDYDDAVAVMQRLVEQEGLTPVHGVNHIEMPCGAGTMTLEILEQAAAMNVPIDAMVVAIGGGSQAVGAMTVLRERAPQVEVIGVQAAGAPTIHHAWQARKTGEPLIEVTQPVNTMAEGLATRSTYALTFEALCAGLSDFVLVSEAELASAVRLLLRTTQHLAEPAGAAGLAGAMQLRERLAGQTVVVVLSGANVDLATLRQVLASE